LLKAKHPNLVFAAHEIGDEINASSLERCENVPAGPTYENIEADTAIEIVIPGSAYQDVTARAAKEVIVVGTTLKRITAATSDQSVIAGAT
jgi:hypothetical protein